MSVFLLVLTFWLGWLIIEANLSVLTRRASKVGDLLRKLTHPDFRYFLKEDPIFALRRGSYSILDLMVLTLFMTLISTTLGTALAFPLSFLGARNIMGFHPLGLAIYTFIRGFFNVVRSIETLLWGTIFAVWVGWGSPFAGVLALTVHTVAALGKLFSEQVEGIQSGPVEAVRATGNRGELLPGDSICCHPPSDASLLGVYPVPLGHQRSHVDSYRTCRGGRRRNVAILLQERRSVGDRRRCRNRHRCRRVAYGLLERVATGKDHTVNTPTGSGRYPASVVDSLMHILKQIRRNWGLFLLDSIAVGSLWVIITYMYSWFAYGPEHGAYLLVPWWIFLLGSVEMAALWESFGVSFGQTILRVRLLGANRQPATLRQSAIHFVAWHASVLLIIGSLALPPLHERLSGLTLQPLVTEGIRPEPWYRRSTGIYLALLAAVVAIVAVSVTITPQNIVRLFTHAWRIAPMWKALVSPNLAILEESFSDLIVTIFMAVMATLFATVIAAPLSFFAARNLARGLVRRIVYTILRGAMSIFRSIEPIVWAIVFLVWVTSGHASFAGVLALWIHSIADLTKLYAERLESIDEGLVEAISATGAIVYPLPLRHQRSYGNRRRPCRSGGDRGTPHRVPGRPAIH